MRRLRHPGIYCRVGELFGVSVGRAISLNDATQSRLCQEFGDKCDFHECSLIAPVTQRFCVFLSLLNAASECISKCFQSFTARRYRMLKDDAVGAVLGKKGGAHSLWSGAPPGIMPIAARVAGPLKFPAQASVSDQLHSPALAWLLAVAASCIESCCLLCHFHPRSRMYLSTVS